MRRIVVLLMLMPLAAAQGGGIMVSADTQAVTASADEPAMVRLTVTLPSVAEPFDPLFDPADGEVTVQAQGAPDGWTVAISPSGFNLAPGQSRDVDVTFSVSPGADADAADVNLVVTYVSPDPSGLFLPSSEDSVVIRVVHDESATRDLLEAIGPGIWAILGALVVSAVVAVYLAVDAKTKVVVLTAPTQEIKLRAGETAHIPFWIENRSRESDRFSLNTNPADPEWRGKVKTRGVTLRPNEKLESEFAVTASKSSKPGSRVVVRVVAVPDHAPRRIGVLAVSVKVVD